MKSFYPIQVIDLIFQVDPINPKKFQFFEETRVDSAGGRKFIISIRHTGIERVSDGKNYRE